MKIITIDLEEWYHQLGYPSENKYENSRHLEKRIHLSLDYILETLDEHNIKTCFFTVAQIAQQQPKLIKKIITNGHRLGLHGLYHYHPEKIKRKQLTENIRTAKNIIEDTSGTKIIANRNPGFIMNPDLLWIMDILLDLKIRIDCSICTAKTSHGGWYKYPVRKAHLIKTKHGNIKEFPLNNCFFNSIANTGGGYFRLLPLKLLKHLSKKPNYLMSYFHPRDFDQRLPIYSNFSILRNFRMQYGLQGNRKKLQDWVKYVKPIGLMEANEQIDWSKQVSISTDSLIKKTTTK